MFIPPTVGRRVWYWPLPSERSFEHDQPFDAGITHVFSNDTVALSVVNEYGYPQPGKTRVTLAQGREPQPGECGWMPYQVGQAKAAATPLIGADD